MRIIAFLLLLLPLPSPAQESFTRDFWLNETNTPVKVNAMIQDANGFLWVGTDIGIYRFTGRSFIAITDSIRKPVTALALVNGDIYAGFSSGIIARVIGNSVTAIHIKGVAANSAINSIYSDAAGMILWVCTEQQGVIAVANNIGVQLSTANGLSDDFVYTVSRQDGSIIAGTDKGINEISYSSGKVKVNNITTTEGLPDNIVRVIKRIPGKQSYLVGTQQGGLALYAPAIRQVHPLEGTSLWGQINDILLIDNTTAWLATDDGYLVSLRFNDKSVVVSRPYYYPGKSFKKLLLGRSGIVWGATNQGLTMTTSEYMQYLPIAAPYRLGQLTSVSCDNSNNLWFAQENKLYQLLLNSNGTPQLSLTAPAAITSLANGHDNRLWIGTFGKGLYYRNQSGNLVAVQNIEELKEETILDVTATAERIWVSGLNGVQELSLPDASGKVSLIKKHNKHTGVGSDYVYQVYADSKDRIWMATDGAGICMFANGKYKRWARAEGFNSTVVYTITEDAFGNIWAATLSNGLYKYDGKQWQHISTGHGLQDLNISTLAANRTGQVAVVHAKGIDVWYPESGQFRNYGRRPGAISIDSTSNTLKLFANDTAGNMYLPFEKGFVVLKNVRPGYDIRPVTDITAVSVFLKPVETDLSSFSHSDNHISFSYEGGNFANPERLRYRYKLEGYNDNWTLTTDESVTFPQLPPGNYKFRVQASLNNIFGNKGEATYSFTIAYPFWQKPLFIFFAAVVAFAIAYWYIRFRERNLRKLSLLQRERMKFEYEHLKSQVNPHFLFNSLNTLTSLIEEDAESATAYTSRLSDLYRNALSHRDKDLIFLNEEWEILENYMYIQKTRFGDALHLEAKVPEELMRTKKIVPLALQLLAENAIKHNIVSRSAPLTITIEADEHSITIRNPVRPKISKEKGEGLGIMNIRNRYSLLSKEQINYGIRNNEYIVTLPLL
jgi:ligand-binding sensor domain-containing protein